MRLRTIPWVAILTIWTTAAVGCGTIPIQTSWPRRRPLGADIPTFRSRSAAVQPKGAGRRVKEPEGKLTLRRALALALMKNPVLAAYAWEARAREARVLQARKWPNPRIEVEVENFGAIGRLGPVEAIETTVRLSQVIELGSKSRKRAAAAAGHRDLAGWDYEAKRIQVFVETTRAFVQVLAAQKRVALMERILSTWNEVVRVVGQRATAGKIPAINKLKAEVAVQNARLARIRARRELEAARRRLAAQWGTGEPRFQKVAGNLSPTKAIPTFNRLTRQLDRNPALARWTAVLRLRRAVIERERAGRIPDLTVSAGARHLNETRSFAFVFSLSIPIPLFNRNQGSIREAESRLRQAEHQKKAARLQLLKELASAYKRLTVAHAEVSLLMDKILPRANEVLRAAREGFDRGKFGYLQVLDAQRTFFRVNLQFINALADLHRAITDVEGLVGRSLESARNKPEEKSGAKR